MKVLIIGNGITGTTAALKIRKLQPDWEIRIISGETDLFFSRPALMYLSMGHMTLENTQPHDHAFFAEQRLDLHHGEVTGVDTGEHRIRLRDGGDLPYDKLLIATGSQSNKFGWPGQDLDGVQGFYDLNDLRLLENNTAGIKCGVIVGGGLIGVKFAEILHARGIDVTILAREESYWDNVMPKAESQLITDVIRANGIDLRLQTGLEEIVDDGTGRVCAVITGDGERIECGLVGLTVGRGWVAFCLTYGLLTIGSLGWVADVYRGTIPGIKNHGTTSTAMQNTRWPAWLLAAGLTVFYLAYYWWPHYLQGVTRLSDPMSFLLRGVPADHWFLYGYLYTLAVMIMGVRMILRYRHNRYQMLRTASLMFFQLIVAFLIPSVLRSLNQPEFYFSYFWPLQPKYLYPGEIKILIQHPGGLGTFMAVWGATATFIATPILTYLYGKRWYCSWVCGCGGLAETAGDPFRHLSDSSVKAWKIERWTIHSVLVIVTLGTILLWIDDATGGGVLHSASLQFKKAYGFAVASVLAGLVGVAVYPVLGSRIWCRFFCPMAAILGIIQRFFSRFRITTNGGQCIS